MTETEEATEGPVVVDLLAPVQGGQMLARNGGQVVFVQGGLPGETVGATVVARKRGYLEAVALSLSSASSGRVTPPCRYFGENGVRRGAIDQTQQLGSVCGGCQYQHADYETQLELKRLVLAEQLRRVGRILDAPVRPLVGSPEPYHYRNKAAWLVTQDGDLAYHEGRSHRPVPIEQCDLLSPGLTHVFDKIRGAAAEIGLGGLVRAIEARSLPTDAGDQASLLLTADQHASPPEMEALAVALLDVCHTVVGVSLKGSLEGDSAVLCGKSRLSTTFLGEVYTLSPTTFFQVNVAAAELMARYALENVGPLRERQIADVYSGAGTFAIPLARGADAVIGIEADAVAVDDARDTMERLGLENITLLAGDAGANLRALLPGSMDAVVVDPPRSGCAPEVLRQLARIKARRLIYVSCDPATLARDLRVLLDHGYELEIVQPFDLFPQTAHIESVAVLRLPRKHRPRR